MAALRHLRSKSAPAALPAGPRRAAALLEPQPVAQPPKAPTAPSQLSNGSPTTSKKRKVSTSEPSETKPQQESKKQRKSEPPAPKKVEPQPQEQADSQRAASEPPAPSLKKKASKKDLTPQKDQSSKSPLVTGSGISKTWPKSVGKQKIKGLSNPGNWCYRRSVLQSLIAVPQFFNFLDESHKSCPKQGKCVTCALRQLIRAYHTSPGGVGRDLNALDNAIRVTGKTSDPKWRAGGQTQEDSHEFLQYLLGTVESAKGVQKDQFASLFRIKHKISWKCEGCSKVHVRSDPPGLSLNLPIPKGQATIASCLDTYHREPNVTIRCDKCKKNAKRTRNFQIEDAPDVLPIQLMRFGFGITGPTKNKQHVDFPEDLDLSRWALDRSKPLKYKLQAVVAHSGTLRFGHYIAYVRGPDGRIHDISDSDVSNSNAKEWRKPSSGFHPYILVYIKQ